MTEVEKQFLDTLVLHSLPVRFSKCRIGRPNDGGYVVVNDKLDAVALYSYGISDDCSFDDHFCSKFDIPGFCYDHTINSFPYHNANLTWKREGISSGHGSFKEQLASNGHLGKKIALKMDVEGYEWKFFKDIGDELENVTQAAFEFHFHQDVGCFHQNYNEFLPVWSECLQKLSKYMTLIHAHHNNWGGWLDVGGVKIPLAFEATYINKNICSCEFNKQNLPIPGLDKPNNGGSDTRIDWWPFVTK